jgi:hypothetical protein
MGSMVMSKVKTWLLVTTPDIVNRIEEL